MDLTDYKISEIKNKHIYGRTGKVLQPLPLFTNGSGIEVVNDGTELWIDVTVGSSFHDMWVAYEVNGYLMGRQMLLPGEHSICLFRNMTPGIAKKIKFYREVQGMSDDANCCIAINSLKADGEFLPVPEHKYKIEFIGDSITSGEGTYGALEDSDWIPMYMSYSHDYTKMVTDSMNADYHILSQGGWGVYISWDSNLEHNLPGVYERVCGLSCGEDNITLGAHDAYDFEWQPDAIVVNLGTNDSTGTKESGNRAGIKPAVIQFLKMLREHNPKAHIVWVYGMLGYDISAILSDAVNTYMEETKDMNVAYLTLPNTRPDGLGSHGHPGDGSHRESAVILTDYLTGILG